MKRLLVTLTKKSDTASDCGWRVDGATSAPKKRVRLELAAMEARRSRPINDVGPTAYAASLVVVWHCEKWTKKERWKVQDWANGRAKLSRLETELYNLREKLHKFAAEVGGP